MELEEILKRHRVLKPGEIIDSTMATGRYVIAEALSSPKYGDIKDEPNSVIYRARQRAIGEVVLKGINHYVVQKLLETGEYERADEHLNMFSREVKWRRRLNHPNITKSYPLVAQGNMQFIPIEYVSQDFGDMFKHITLREFIFQMCDVIEYLQKRGIVHRDLKKESIGYDPKTEKVKLIDFGLTTEPKETSGIIYGYSEGYVPDEAKRGIIHPTYDIYSLGNVIRNGWKRIQCNKRESQRNASQETDDEEITAKGKITAKGGRKSQEISLIELTDYPDVCAVIMACEGVPPHERNIQKVRELAGKVQL